MFPRTMTLTLYVSRANDTNTPFFSCISCISSFQNVGKLRVFPSIVVQITTLSIPQIVERNEHKNNKNENSLNEHIKI
jgi:hypothetical protein